MVEQKALNIQFRIVTGGVSSQHSSNYGHIEFEFHGH